MNLTATDGGWSEWGIWNTCSETCGSGAQERVRTCTNPLPSGGGIDCSGSMDELQECIVQDCLVEEITI